MQRGTLIPAQPDVFQAAMSIASSFDAPCQTPTQCGTHFRDTCGISIRTGVSRLFAPGATGEGYAFRLSPMLYRAARSLMLTMHAARRGGAHRRTATVRWGPSVMSQSPINAAWRFSGQSRENKRRGLLYPSRPRKPAQHSLRSTARLRSRGQREEVFPK